MNLIQVEPGDKVAAMTKTRGFPEDRFLLFATKRGLVKKTVLSAYGNVRAAGIIAINLEEDDELLSVQVTDGARQVFLGTRNGMGLKFTETDVRPMGRDTTGVKGIELREGDEVVEMDPVDEEGTLLAVTQLGFGKRTDVAEYRHQTRGGTGVINFIAAQLNQSGPGPICRGCQDVRRSCTTCPADPRALGHLEALRADHPRLAEEYPEVDTVIERCREAARSHFGQNGGVR